MVSEIYPGQDFISQGHTARSKVKSRSHHDIVHLHPLTNVPTKYHLPIPYGLQDIARTNFFPQPTRLPAHPDIMGENNTGSRVKNPKHIRDLSSLVLWANVLPRNICCEQRSCGQMSVHQNCNSI